VELLCAASKGRDAACAGGLAPRLHSSLGAIRRWLARDTGQASAHRAEGVCATLALPTAVHMNELHEAGSRPRIRASMQVGLSVLSETRRPTRRRRTSKKRRCQFCVATWNQGEGRAFRTISNPIHELFHASAGAWGHTPSPNDRSPSCSTRATSAPLKTSFSPHSNFRIPCERLAPIYLLPPKVLRNTAEAILRHQKGPALELASTGRDRCASWDGDKA